MSALGPQGSEALRSADILLTDAPLDTESDYLGGGYRLPADWEPLGMTDAARNGFQAQEASRLKERVAELEAENAHLLRQLDAARERGRIEERAVQAKTMGGRLPSILRIGRK